MLEHQFPDPDLAAALLPLAFDAPDGAHDVAHLLRVWRNAAAIRAEEGGDSAVLQAAVLLHDGVNLPKDAPDRAEASRRSAARAREILAARGWGRDACRAVAHAIEAHSYSAGIPPQSLEARILRDADRLDAIGFIGAARCFYVAGLRRAAIHDAADPGARARALDDGAFALDHFATKLLRLGEGFCTGAGARMAEARIARLAAFRDGLLEEIGGA
ncbi:HD domain-containing protein [Poseidonocella sp. HB161398]|uniref:HD domain-containing protein n=1 Tax=Poseidonocella sp. HB161398 TaxID=2320855 RepID=UPI00110969A2|nr:HD domain-containing protein [Poseidonocella sp. HB161398]